MDDYEYYSLMRKQNFHHTQISGTKKKSDYKKWASFQGREDAEMLVEKKEEPSTSDTGDSD